MIDLVRVSDRTDGNKKAHDLLKKIVDGQTLLALSGGTTPNYRKMIVEPGDISPGAICVADERYGEPFHKDSNELLLKNQGVKDCTDEKCIEAHKTLKGLDFLETAKEYNFKIKELFARFPKRVGVMGIGANLHTAGIFPNSVAAHSPNLVVGEVVDDRFPKRITLTLKALGEFQYFVILVFGQEKKDAILKMLDESENDMQKYPAIFYRKSKAKAYLITDLEL